MSTADEALARVGRATRALWILGVVFGVYLSLAVTVASVIGVANSFRAVELGQQALEQARTNGDVAQLIRECVEPTPEGVEPTDCVRNGDARTGRAVAAIVDAIQQALQRIEAALGR